MTHCQRGPILKVKTGKETLHVITCACGEEFDADSDEGVRYLLRRHMRKTDERGY